MSVEIWNRPEVSSPFIPGTLIQFAWDSTSIGWLKQCPRLYQYQMVEGWFPKGDNPHLKFGLVYHSALELFDRLLVKGVEREEAVQQAVLHAMKATYGWVSDHSVKNRETLVRTIVWYTEHYKIDPAPVEVLADGNAAVEVSFRFELDKVAPHGEPYMLSGHFDKIIKFVERLFISDKKTSGHQLDDRFFDGFNMDTQMSLYTLAGKVVMGLPIAGVLIDAAQVAVGFSAFLRGITYRTEERLAEWVDDLKTILSQNEEYATRQHWPMNDKSCNNYMDAKGFGGCPFKKVCGRQPSQRESILKTEFVRKRWNPLVPRTEDTSTRS